MVVDKATPKFKLGWRIRCIRILQIYAFIKKQFTNMHSAETTFL